MFSHTHTESTVATDLKQRTQAVFGKIVCWSVRYCYMAAFQKQALTWNFIQPWANASTSSGDQVSAIWAHGIGYMLERKCTQAHSRILLWWMARPISTGWSPNGRTFFETDWHLMLLWLIWIESAAKWLEDIWPEPGSLCWCHFLCQRCTDGRICHGSAGVPDFKGTLGAGNRLRLGLNKWPNGGLIRQWIVSNSNYSGQEGCGGLRFDPANNDRQGNFYLLGELGNASL